MDSCEANLIEAYIRANDVTGDDSSSWANDELQELVWQEPERSRPIILAIIERNPPIWILSTLAAGPLEDLLLAHGPLFIDRVENEALQNDRVREVLSHIYPIACRPDVAERVRSAVGNRERR